MELEIPVYESEENPKKTLGLRFSNKIPENESALYTCSMCQKRQSGPQFARVVDYIIESKIKVTILLADSLQVPNILLQSYMSEKLAQKIAPIIEDEWLVEKLKPKMSKEEAEKVARQIGDKWLETNKDALEKLKKSGFLVAIKRWNDYKNEDKNDNYKLTLMTHKVKNMNKITVYLTFDNENKKKVISYSLISSKGETLKNVEIRGGFEFMQEYNTREKNLGFNKEEYDKLLNIILENGHVSKNNYEASLSVVQQLYKENKKFEKAINSCANNTQRKILATAKNPINKEELLELEEEIEEIRTASQTYLEEEAAVRLGLLFLNLKGLGFSYEIYMDPFNDVLTRIQHYYEINYSISKTLQPIYIVDDSESIKNKHKNKSLSPLNSANLQTTLFQSNISDSNYSTKKKPTTKNLTQALLDSEQFALLLLTSVQQNQIDINHAQEMLKRHINARIDFLFLQSCNEKLIQAPLSYDLNMPYKLKENNIEQIPISSISNIDNPENKKLNIAVN